LLAELSTTMVARFLFDPGQAQIVPSSVAKMKDEDTPFTWKSVFDALATIPVGVPGPFKPVASTGPFPAVGIVTFSADSVPAAL
jgi:hypothetical protein